MTSKGLEVLNEAECYERLASSTLGRVSVHLGDAPAILPVNYALLGRDVVFRTDPGSKLTAALMGVQVAFEVDAAPTPDTAWSVLVVGYVEEVRDAPTLAEVAELGLEPWAGGIRDRVVRIDVRSISGRALGHGATSGE
ncbi:MAG: pyridoxamine 5'-phosphate oxidase family protein [Acidimicrobiia bacterium]